MVLTKAHFLDQIVAGNTRTRRGDEEREPSARSYLPLFSCLSFLCGKVRDIETDDRQHSARLASFVCCTSGCVSILTSSSLTNQVQEAEAKRKADRAAKFEEGRRLKQVKCKLNQTVARDPPNPRAFRGKTESHPKNLFELCCGSFCILTERNQF